VHFRYVLAKIKLKNLEQHFDWGWPGPSGYALATANQKEINSFFILNTKFRM